MIEPRTGIGLRNAECPECGEACGLVDRHCRWCGERLREGSA